MKNTNRKVQLLCQGGIIAALYVVLTLIANAFGLANYSIQVRFSEALTILPFFTPAAIPGLFVGCLVSNILTGCMPLDVIFGSLATLAGAVVTYLLRKKNKFLAPIPPIVANAIVVPLVIKYVYMSEDAYLFSLCTVTIGEIISCGVLGMLLLTALYKRRNVIFGGEA